MHTEMVYQNPQASSPLRYGLDVVCNVDDETILRNCLANAKKVKRWVQSQPAHNRTLLICGSGPSIRDDVETIRKMQEDGAEVWALNNCANFLASLDILPDAQVIMDAQPVTVNAIGPAKEHYFASQCDPSLFDTVKDAILWHSTHGDTRIDEQEGFPDHDDAYCLIGSAVSVGNTALVLAYALGYRKMHLFGYDSSIKGESSHAIRQWWNDGEPMTIREFRGKKYVCSLTMSLQADAFSSRAAILEREGCDITVHGYGFLPDRWNAEWTEQEKYNEVWRFKEYGDESPGARAAAKFIEVVKPDKWRFFADFGCGSGRGALEIIRLLDIEPCQMALVDFADGSRIDEAKSLRFIHANLSESIPIRADYGYCCDVMEHIPPELVEKTIRNIMGACSGCFFQICTVQDDFCGLIGTPLHLTVKPHSWWRELFVSLGYAVRWEEEGEITASFYIASTGDNK